MVFGLPRLDAALGPARDAPTAIVHPDEIDPRPFLDAAAALAMAGGASVVYISLTRPGAIVRRSVEEATVRIGGSIDLPRIDERTAPPAGSADGARLHVVTGIKAAVRALENCDLQTSCHLVAEGAQRLLVGPQGERLEAWLAVVPVVASVGTGDDLDRVLQRFPNVVRLHQTSHKIVLQDHFIVEQVGRRRQRGLPAVPVPYTVRRGLREQVPKVLVVGPDDAGKTTFVHAVSERAVSIDRAGRTVAMDWGLVARGGREVAVFGAPGDRRLEGLLGPMLSGAAGVLVLVNSACPESFARVQDMVQRVRRNGVHVMVVANKQDLEEARSVTSVAAAIAASRSMQVVACQAIDPASAIAVFDSFVQQILAGEVSE